MTGGSKCLETKRHVKNEAINRNLGKLRSSFWQVIYICYLQKLMTFFMRRVRFRHRFILLVVINIQFRNFLYNKIMYRKSLSTYRNPNCNLPIRPSNRERQIIGFQTIPSSIIKVHSNRSSVLSKRSTVKKLRLWL